MVCLETIGRNINFEENFIALSNVYFFDFIPNSLTQSHSRFKLRKGSERGKIKLNDLERDHPPAWKLNLKSSFKDADDWKFRIPYTNNWVRRKEEEWFMGQNGAENVDLKITCPIVKGKFTKIEALLKRKLFRRDTDEGIIEETSFDDHHEGQ